MYTRQQVLQAQHNLYQTFSFYQHYNSAKDTFNICDDEDYDKVKAEVIKLLRMKYSLEIISEDPLDFKKIEY